MPHMLAVISDGRSGSEHIRDLRSEGSKVGYWGTVIMESPEFVTTSGVTYKLVVISGEEFADKDRTTQNIQVEAERRGYLTPPAETAPLLRETVSDEKLRRMGLSALVVMHEPILDTEGHKSLLVVGRAYSGKWIDSFEVSSDEPWKVRDYGFVFLAP